MDRCGYYRASRPGVKEFIYSRTLGDIPFYNPARCRTAGSQGPLGSPRTDVMRTAIGFGRSARMCCASARVRVVAACM